MIKMRAPHISRRLAVRQRKILGSEQSQKAAPAVAVRLEPVIGTLGLQEHCIGRYADWGCGVKQIISSTGRVEHRLSPKVI